MCVTGGILGSALNLFLFVIFYFSCCHTGDEGGTLRGKGGRRKSDKNRRFPMLPSVARHRVALLGQQCKHRVCTPFPYVFPLALPFPSPFSPLCRFFADTRRWVFATRIGAAATRLGHLPFYMPFSEQQSLGGCDVIGRLAKLGRAAARFEHISVICLLPFRYKICPERCFSRGMNYYFEFIITQNYPCVKCPLPLRAKLPR